VRQKTKDNVTHRILISSHRKKVLAGQHPGNQHFAQIPLFLRKRKTINNIRRIS
jgi:hypothetical protein